VTSSERGGDRRCGTDRRNPVLGGRRATDHGTRVAYQYDGCRCPLCTRAEAEYHARYAKGLIPGWVDARARISSACAAGRTTRLASGSVGSPSSLDGETSSGETWRSSTATVHHSPRGAGLDSERPVGPSPSPCRGMRGGSDRRTRLRRIAAPRVRHKARMPIRAGLDSP